MKQFHCLKNETSYLCTSIIHPIWLILPFPLHIGFRTSFHCLLGKPNYWLQVPSWFSYARQKLKEHLQHKQLLFTSAAHIWKESAVFSFILGFFSSITPLSFLTVVPSGFLLDKELLQASHCQMNFTRSPKIVSVALNLHPHYPNIWLAELHMSKTGFSISWSSGKQPSNNLPHSYIVWVSFHHQETFLSLVAFLQILYVLLQKVKKTQNLGRGNLQ